MSSSSSKKSASVSAADDINFDVSLYTDMVLMAKEPKKNKSIPYADRVANKTPDGQLRRGTTTYRTPGARSAILRLFNSVDVASLGDDLVMITLKYKGSRAKRLRLAPNDESVNGQIERFDMLLSEELGTPAKFLWFKDFNDPYLGGGVHGHFLLSRGGRGARGFDRLVRGCWAEASGQEFDAPGENAWTPTVTEFWYGETPEQTFKNFVRYEAQKFNPETGEVEKKIAQKRVDQAWLDSDNYQVKWAGISDALIPATPRKFKITCACGNADIRSVMQKHSPAERNVVQFDCRENLGEKVDIDLGRWSYDLTDKGCTEFIRVTPELIEDIAAVEEAHAGCTGPAPVAAEEAPTAPAATPQSSTPAGAPMASSASTALSLTKKKESIMNPCHNLDTVPFKSNPSLFLSNIKKTIETSQRGEISLHDLLVVTDAMSMDGVEAFTADEQHTLADMLDELIDRYRHDFSEDQPWFFHSGHDRNVDMQWLALDVFESIDALEEQVSEQIAIDQEQLANRSAVKALLRESRIEAGAVKITARFESLVPHLKAVAPDDVAAFEALSPLDQFDELLAPAAPVEIPRIASDPHARRPRFVAGLTSRTDADLEYLAAFVRLERSADAMVAHGITLDDHVSNYERETNLIDQLMASGKMTPIPVEWIEARRVGAL